MSDLEGYEDEMLRRHLLDDDTTEAILSGRIPARDDLAPLAAFAEDARALATRTAPVPTASLAAMMADSLSTDKGDLLATAASNVHGPASQVSELPKWRKKKMMVSELVAGLSLTAKALLGTAVAAAAVTGAAAAGALPDAAQHAVSSAVSTVTPINLPDPTTSNHADFGKSVSSDANGTTDGTTGVNGKTVAGTASQNGLTTANGTPAAGHVPTSVPGAPTTGHGSSGAATPPVSTPPVSTPPVSTPPVSTPPVSTPPVSTPPVTVPSQAGSGLSHKP